jgi:hypothetical protein
MFFRASDPYHDYWNTFLIYSLVVSTGIISTGSCCAPEIGSLILIENFKRVIICIHNAFFIWVSIVKYV